MQSMQIRDSEMMAANPLRANIEAPSPAPPESFGACCQRQINAAEFDGTGIDSLERHPNQNLNANQNGIISDNSRNNADGSLRSGSVRESPIERQTRANGRATRKNGEPSVDSDQSSEMKGSPTAPGVRGSTEDGTPQPAQAPTISAIAINDVAGDVTAAGNLPSAMPKLAVSFHETKIASQASTTAATTVISKPVEAGEKNSAGARENHTATAALEPGAKLDQAQAVAAPCASTSGWHEKTEIAQTASHSLQLNSPEVVERTATASTHVPASGTGKELPLYAAPITGAAGVRTYTAFPPQPTQLDVGVFDATHGWLRIRAELGESGAVSASLTAASGSAHESLRAALPEMAKYLQSEEVSVIRISVHRSVEGSAMEAAQGGSLQKGDTRGHEGGGDNRNYCDGTTSKNSTGSDDAPSSGLATTKYATYSRGSGERSSHPRLESLSEGFSTFGITPWFPKGSSGSWLNVCA